MGKKAKSPRTRYRDIVGYEGLYYVSSRGEIFRYEKPNQLTGGVWEEKQLTPKNNHGYHRVMLSKDGEIKHWAIHRIVAFAFIKNKCPEKIFVNHINGVRNDNRVENLEWCTAKENSEHAHRLGLIDLTKLRKTKRDASILTARDVARIRKLYKQGKSSIQIGKIFGISRQYANDIRMNRRWVEPG